MGRKRIKEQNKDYRHVWQLHSIPTGSLCVFMCERRWVWVCLPLHFIMSLPSSLLSEHQWCYLQETFSIEHIALTFFRLCHYTLFSLLSLFTLPFWCEVGLTRLGLTQTAKPVERPSPNYSHPPAWLPSAPSLSHKHTQTRKCLILCGSPPYNHMSLQYSGRAKSSIIPLTYAPLVKGEQYVKWLTLQFSAEFCAILVTGRRKDCRGGGKKEFTFLPLLSGSCKCIFNEAVSRGMLDHNEALVR